mmetsp:Transcript_51287/g.160171  ORF Transcript_51287/g.160171 Transcript_51287/m.160171 type:complete len:364 (+) Transcript_51287:381-1472(+)
MLQKEADNFRMPILSRRLEGSVVDEVEAMRMQLSSTRYRVYVAAVDGEEEAADLRMPSRGGEEEATRSVRVVGDVGGERKVGGELSTGSWRSADVSTLGDDALKQVQLSVDRSLSSPLAQTVENLCIERLRILEVLLECRDTSSVFVQRDLVLLARNGGIIVGRKRIPRCRVEVSSRSELADPLDLVDEVPDKLIDFGQGNLVRHQVLRFLCSISDFDADFLDDDESSVHDTSSFLWGRVSHEGEPGAVKDVVLPLDNVARHNLPESSEDGKQFRRDELSCSPEEDLVCLARLRVPHLRKLSIRHLGEDDLLPDAHGPMADALHRLRAARKHDKRVSLRLIGHLVADHHQVINLAAEPFDVHP